MSDVTSANINDLKTFIDGSNTSTTDVQGPALTSAVNKFNTVFPACAAEGGFQVPSTPSLQGLSDLLGVWAANQGFVTVIRNELVQADNYSGDGMATVSDTAIQTSLAEYGLQNAPDLVELADVEMYGMPPYSGFVDDPICLANGNFAHGDEDLDVLGISAPLSVMRMYNSRAQGRIGVFGPGWWSLPDVSLTITDRSVSFAGPDGGGAEFVARADGSFVPDLRRKLTLTRLPDGEIDGWNVTHGHERVWRFDPAGTLIGFTERGADVSVERDDASIRLVDATTGQWVIYRLDGGTGRVSSVESSDGREVTYSYDDAGHLVAAHRVFGDVTYEIDANGFVAVVLDADGVALCRNEYDNAGRVLSQVDAHGRETSYEYRPDGVSTVTATDGAPPNVMVHDRRGRMTAMIDGLGNTMRVAYDDLDNVVQRVDPSGARTRFLHDERGNVIQRIDPDELSHTYEWDELDRLVADTDRAGNTTRYFYEGQQRSPVRVVQADGSEVVAEYNDFEQPVLVSDADGVTARFEWNRDGLMVAMTDGLGARTTFEYNSVGRSIGARNPNGIFASLGLDHAGRVRTMRTADGEETFEYSPGGRMVGGSLLGGSRWQAVFDDAGDVEQVINTLGESVAFERDLVGQVTALIAADGTRYSYEYDPVGRTTATVDPVGNRSEIGHDPEGRPLLVTDASGRTYSREMDELGRTVAAAYPGGGTSLRSYHPNGELASVTDAEGNDWTYDVDAMGRVIASTDPLGNTTTYSYTPAGRLADVTSPLGRVVRREYDAAGRLAKLIEPDGTEVVFERRADGKVVRAVRDGLATSFDYDEAGRESAIAGPWSDVSAERVDGNISALSAQGAAAAQFSYDPRGLLASVADPAGVVTEFTHDNRGRLSSQTTGGATTSFGYDEVGRVSAMTDPYGRTTSYLRDERGINRRTSRADGTVNEYNFGGDGLLEAVFNADEDEVLRLRRDLNGAVTGATAGGFESSLARDARGRIVRVTTDAGVVSYEWDEDGYLAARSDDSGYRVVVERGLDGKAQAFVLTDGTRVSAPAEIEVERDDSGRVVTDEHGRQYSYDLAGRLAGATVGDQTTTYGYNDLGLLSVEQSAAGVRRYSYGLAGELVIQTLEDGSEVTFDHDAAGRRIAQSNTDGSSIRYGWDDLGRLTQVLMVEADGTEHRHRIDYDPFGRPLRIDDTPILWDTGAGNLLGIGDQRFLWSGNHVRVAGDPVSQWDRRISDDPWGDDGQSGVRLGYRGELAVDNFILLGARVYDTHTRSFLTRDPLPSVPGAVTFAGVYSYAWCDPINYVDPSGRRPLSDEDYSALRDAQASGTFEKAWDTMVNDPWGTLAMVAVTAVGVALVATGVGGPIGVGILVGVGTSAVMGLATGSFNPRSVALNGVIGGVTGGMANGANITRTVAINAGGGMTGSVLDQTIIQGRSLDEISVGQVLFDGALAGGVSAVPHGWSALRNARGANAVDDVVPTQARFEVDSTGRVNDLAPPASDDLAVVGRQWDTAVAQDWPGHEVLDIPDWTIARNDDWVQSVVDRNMDVYTASPQTKANLWDADANRPTVYARELEQLQNAGYVPDGDYLRAPGG